MTNDAQLADAPMGVTMDLLFKAFNPEGRRRREAMRILKRALNLAISRGFREAEALMNFFSQSPKLQNPKILRRILFNLFEYVSPEEFALLSKSMEGLGI